MQMVNKDQWVAAIGRQFGPRYIAIVEALVEMIESGQLREKQQIPTQRELARMLGLTPGTTARAYAIAAERGLISGETGRGTFVRRGASAPRLPQDADYVEDRATPPARGGQQPAEPGLLGDLAVPNVGAANLAPELHDAIGRASEDFNFTLGRYHPHGAQVGERFRQVGVNWFARLGLTVDIDNVVLTSGAHAALYVILFSENLRRLPVMTPVLTFAGLRNIAIAHDHPLIPIEVDEEGPVVKSIELGCKQSGGRVLYLQSIVHNPTCFSTSEARLREIVEIARKFDLIIIEDNAAPLAFDKGRVMAATLAPERTLLITSGAKSISPSVNVGFLAVPRGWASQLNTAIKTHHVYASMFNVEVIKALLESGALDRICEESKALVGRRIAIAHEMLAPYALRAHPLSWLAWLELPGMWTSEAFTTAARVQGVALGGSQNFVIAGVRPDMNGVRLALTSPSSDEAFSRYLGTVRNLLHAEEARLGTSV
ncbi:MAG: PLP-dependent aminotransferase family protein [Reyranellaceae bacterium]